MKYDAFLLTLSKKLGWDEMLASVAIPALEAIIENYSTFRWNYRLTTSSLEESIIAINDNILFGYLVDNNDYHPEEVHALISLRYEIEELMFAGYSYQEAINEWFK